MRPTQAESAIIAYLCIKRPEREHADRLRLQAGGRFRTGSADTRSRSTHSRSRLPLGACEGLHPLVASFRRIIWVGASGGTGRGAAAPALARKSATALALNAMPLPGEQQIRNSCSTSSGNKITSFLSGDHVKCFSDGEEKTTVLNLNILITGLGVVPYSLFWASDPRHFRF